MRSCLAFCFRGNANLDHQIDSCNTLKRTKTLKGRAIKGTNDEFQLFLVDELVFDFYVCFCFLVTIN